MHWWGCKHPQCPQHILLEAEAPCHKPHMRSVHLDQEQPVFHHAANNEEMWQCFMALDSTPRNIYLTLNVFLIHFSCKLNVWWVSTFWFWAFQLCMCCYREKIIEVHSVYDYVCVHADIAWRVHWRRGGETYCVVAFENPCHLHCVNTGLWCP